MDGYKKHLEKVEEDKRLNPGKYLRRCGDCGQFLKRDRWITKNDRVKRWPLCWPCADNYEDPQCY